jgi:stage II sporulation protein M
MKKRKKPKYLDTKEQFKEAITYIKESSIYIWSAILLFILSIITGYLNHENLTFIDKILMELLSKTQNLNTEELIFFILQNNLQSSLYALFFGAFLGIFPIVSAITNGVVIGYVLQKVQAVAGLGEWWRLLPHGIFELPAIFISFGLGIKLGFFVFAKSKTKEFLHRFYKSMNVGLMVIIPLLIIAATIEGLLIILFK